MVSRSLEERIAELNRQSTEARDKLLQLIDQQKSAAADMVPPTLSPVPPPSLNYTGEYPASGETTLIRQCFSPLASPYLTGSVVVVRITLAVNACVVQTPLTSES